MSKKTQVESYKKSEAKQSEREWEIVKLLSKESLSRRQIAKILEVESNCVSGAVKSLLAKGEIIEIDATVYDEETGRNQSLLMLAENSQMPAKIKKTYKELFEETQQKLKVRDENLNLAIKVLQSMVSTDPKLWELAKSFAKVAKNEKI